MLLKFITCLLAVQVNDHISGEHNEHTDNMQEMQRKQQQAGKTSQMRSILRS